MVEHPTWEDISALITDRDVKEMKAQGLDLRDYSQVAAMAHKIYYYLGYKIMPPGRPWSESEIATYNNWLIDGSPRDEAHREQIQAERQNVVEDASVRVREDIESLDDGKVTLLKKAFQELMDRDPKSPDEYDPDTLCYFSLAAKHWYPVPTFCQHHIYGYLPWHRFQMLDFENALRSVPGCEEVTLPYWNIETGQFPALFQEEPFVSYTFPLTVYPGFYKPSIEVGKKGTKTKRNSTFDHSGMVNTCIGNAKAAPTFSDYNGITDYEYDRTWQIIRAHDAGHIGSGPTMANQDIAAFDPMFWFFHCNWDRLWWEWQQSRCATTLDTFNKILGPDDDHRWLTGPQMSISDPWKRSASETIDLSKLRVSYDSPPLKAETFQAAATPVAMGPSWRDAGRGHSKVETFSIPTPDLERVSLRVQDVNRIKVPGSFEVLLLLGGEVVGRDVFFQSTFSGDCENCVAQALVSFEFLFDRKHLLSDDGVSKEVTVKIVNVVTGETMDFKNIGEPTISIRLLH